MSVIQQMLLGTGANEVLPLILTYEDNYGDQGGSTPWTLAGMATGTAFANRRNLVAIHAPSTSTVNTNAVTGVTINSNTAGILGTRRHSSNNYHETCFWDASNPTGTTGSVVITTSGGRASMNVVGLFSFDGSRLINSSPVDQQSANTASAASLTVTVTVPDGGSIIAVYGIQSSNSSYSTTWGGTAGLTKVSDRPLNVDQASGSRQSCAFKNFTTGGTFTVTVTPSVTSATNVLNVIVLR